MFSESVSRRVSASSYVASGSEPHVYKPAYLVAGETVI